MMETNRMKSELINGSSNLKVLVLFLLAAAIVSVFTYIKISTNVDEAAINTSLSSLKIQKCSSLIGHEQKQCLSEMSVNDLREANLPRDIFFEPRKTHKASAILETKILKQEAMSGKSIPNMENFMTSGKVEEKQ